MINTMNGNSKAKSKAYLIAKRITDVLFSGIGLIILSPVFVIVAIAIKLDSKGPIFFKQDRVGKDEELFSMYKFRSMVVNAEELKKALENQNEMSGPMFKMKKDPRITRVGRFIRKTSIDELPQFYNIFKGDMSLIGPRPERPYFVNKFRESVPKYMIKHHVKPGMTGWAQVNGYRGNTSIVKRIKYDIYYVENWSIMLDIRIFFKTLPALLNDKNAY